MIVEAPPAQRRLLHSEDPRAHGHLERPDGTTDGRQARWVMGTGRPRASQLDVRRRCLLDQLLHGRLTSKALDASRWHVWLTPPRSRRCLVRRGSSYDHVHAPVSRPARAEVMWMHPVGAPCGSFSWSRLSRFAACATRAGGRGNVLPMAWP